MAKYAFTTPGGPEIDDAEDLPLHGNKDHYCTTEGCTARMFVRSPQKPSACFVSYDISEHTGGFLCHLKDKFKSDQYSERDFSPAECFDRILSPPKKCEPTSHYGSGGCGNNQLIAITTIKMLYLMCIQYRDYGYYNGYPINEMLIDRFNYKRYKGKEITGNKIIACTFFRYDLVNQDIYMNSPEPYSREYLKLHIEERKMFEKCKIKLVDKTHKHISVIAGNWRTSTEENCIAECEITSVGKQICKGD